MQPLVSVKLGTAAKYPNLSESDCFNLDAHSLYCRASTRASCTPSATSGPGALNDRIEVDTPSLMFACLVASSDQLTLGHPLYHGQADAMRCRKSLAVRVCEHQFYQASWSSSDLRCQEDWMFNTHIDTRIYVSHERIKPCSITASFVRFGSIVAGT